MGTQNGTKRGHETEGRTLTQADWLHVFRVGFVPQLSSEGLLALAEALEVDDPRLIQGATTQPPPLMGVREWPVEACCGLSWCAWRAGDGLKTVGEVEEFFADRCFGADQRLGESAACRHFLNAFDDLPRDRMRRELAAEVRSVLAERGSGEGVGRGR